MTLDLCEKTFIYFIFILIVRSRKRTTEENLISKIVYTEEGKKRKKPSQINRVISKNLAANFSSFSLPLLFLSVCPLEGELWCVQQQRRRRSLVSLFSRNENWVFDKATRPIDGAVLKKASLLLIDIHNSDLNFG